MRIVKAAVVQLSPVVYSREGTVDQRADGMHLSYDSMASLIAPYWDESALAVAGERDARIVSLLETAVW